MNAATLHCPTCGAPANPDAHACGYCHARLTAVKCPACFGLAFVGMRHCPACGVALAREEVPDEGVALACPSCSVALRSIRLGESSLRECDGCGGVWVDHPTFHAICRARNREPRFASGRPPVGEPPTPIRVRPVAYLPCPVCGTLMNRQNYARVIVDTCRDHGIWFERGELQRVIGVRVAPSWVW